MPRRILSPAMPLAIHLSEDVESGWKEIRRHALHVVRAYARWAEEEGNSNSPFKGLLDEHALRESGIFAVWTPEELLARVENAQEHATFGFMPLLGGLPPELGWRSLKLLEKVMPRLRALQGNER